MTRTLAAALATGLVLATMLNAAPVGAQSAITISGQSNKAITVEKGKPKTIRTTTGFYEIVVGDPEIANVTPLTDRSFYVLGHAIGTTGIALFDENKQLVGSLDVEVTLDTSRVNQTIRQNVPDANIKVSTANGQIVLSGSAPDKVSADRARDIAKKFSDKGGDVINTVNITSSQQVQLNVRFVEIVRGSSKELGVKFNDLSYTSPKLTDGTIGTAGYSSIAGGFFGAMISGGVSVDVAIKAMEERGVARRLAEPNLVARSGEKASFLAGGEFPIPIAQDDNKITVDYKKYGVSLDFTPTVLADGLINLEIEPEVSSIDDANRLSVGVLSIPSFTVRRAKTSIDLKSGQSFMMAGLFQTQNDTAIERVPGLGSMPVLGPLFSSKKFRKQETDLVMIVTPHLVRPIEPGKPLATPFDQTQPPTTAEAVLGGVDEVRTAQIAKTPAQLKAAKASADMPHAGHILDLDAQ